MDCLSGSGSVKNWSNIKFHKRQKISWLSDSFSRTFLHRVCYDMPTLLILHTPLPFTSSGNMVTVPQCLHIREAFTVSVCPVTQWITKDQSLNCHMLVHLLISYLLCEGTVAHHNHLCAYVQACLLHTSGYYPFLASKSGWTRIPRHCRTKLIST